MTKLLVLMISVTVLIGCEGCSGAEVKKATVESLKCAVKYPLEALTQTVQLAQEMAQATTPEEYAIRLIMWAEKSKDTQFSMCVLAAVRADILNAQPPQPALTSQPVPPVVEAINAFQRAKFGNLKVEPHQTE